jgi:diguanylate cyclase (GGDEF)-like protein
MNNNFSKNITLLYVEDENSIREFLATRLKKVVKEVFVAANGEEGLELFKKHKPDLVITDITMPKMDGIEMSKKIRDIDPDVPITMLTAHDNSNFLLKAIELNISNYITKPIEKNKLFETIENEAKVITINRINIQQQKEIENQKIVLQKIIDSQKSIVILTDFESISFMNKAFEDFFHISSENDFKKRYNSILDVFCESGDYLHKSCIDKKYHSSNKILGNKFYELVNKTDESDRIVVTLDSKLHTKSFYINITNIDPKKSIYLISLLDITKMTIDKLHTEHIAYTDGLTGVANRNKFEIRFKDEFARAKRYNAPLSIVILDIDNFKQFNDNHGHLIGDEILVMIASECKLVTRETDLFARWGGEEFVFLLPQTKLKNAVIVIEKVQTIINNIKHKTAGNITCSFGITEYKEEDSLETIFKRCDDALYKAKENGRDRIETIE